MEILESKETKMTELPYAKNFRELIVYQKARELAKMVYKETLSFPRDEAYSLTDQIRRSSRSVGAQIAEAWAKRKYEKHFVSKLTDADGEQFETQHWIGVAFDCGYLSKEKAVILRDHCDEIGKLLGTIILKADSFCNASFGSIQDEQEVYLTGDQDIQY
jgi:four helix bundle protein